MTEAELNQYKLIKNEIDDLTYRIGHLQEEAHGMSTTKVKGSLACFPYIETHFNVTGPDDDYNDRKKRQANELLRKRENKRVELIEKENEIHDFIYSISDSLVRQIFTLRFIDGKNQDEIGKLLHMDRSTVSKKITKYLEV